MEGNTRKYTVLSFFIVCAMVGYISMLFSRQVGDWLKIGGSRPILLGMPWSSLSIGIGALVGILLLIILISNGKATAFIDDVFTEMQKTTWPNAKETTQSTVAVTIMVGIAVVLLAVVDWAWGLIFRVIL